MRTTIWILVAGLGLAAPAVADDTSKAKPKPADTAAKLTTAELAIVAHMHHVNVMEIDMGKLAQAKGTAAVKRYGEMLVTDHTDADKQLVAFAKVRGVPAIGPDKPTNEAERAEHKAMMERQAKLKTMKGADFDREYLAMMVEGHNNELAKTDPAINAATDGELKRMLESRRGTLQKHADAAKELLKKDAQASTP